MASIVLDPANQTVSAVMSDQEFAIVSLAITANGTDGLVALFAAYLQQQHQLQVEGEKKTIRDAIETLSDAKRGAVVALITGP